MPKRQPDAPADPDKLLKQAAGNYRSADDRFEVRQADVGWFLVDTQQSNEFGQELIHGPLGTLKAVREALPGARHAKAVAAQRAPRRTTRKAEPVKAPEPTWIEKLPGAESRSVRTLIAALEREGVADAEEVVRRDRDGLLPAVAARLIERRIESVVEDAPPDERERARAVARAVAEILTAGGNGQKAPLPGWMLVEIGPEESAPKNRRIDLRDEPPKTPMPLRIQTRA